MNILFQKANDLKNKLKQACHNSALYRGISIKTKGEYKIELENLLRDIEVLTDMDVVDDLVIDMGINNVAKEYANLNKYYKDYYKLMIDAIKRDPGSSRELKALAEKSAKAWDTAYKSVINYLYSKKKKMVYGEAFDDEPDYFSNTPCSSVNVYHANSFADQELPWLRKEDLNEELDEGLKGISLGAASGAILAITVGSLSSAFKIHPKLFTGVSAALGAIIGQFIQKHYFIDFTNYVKLKRYVEYEPEAYELILEMMQRNASKFQQKDPIKYKKILQNLKRLQKNPPAQYRSYLDDEIDRDYEDDPDLFDVRDTDGNLIKSGTSEITSSGGGFRSSGRRRPDRGRTYDVKDLGKGTERNLDDLLRGI